MPMQTLPSPQPAPERPSAGTLLPPQTLMVIASGFDMFTAPYPVANQRLLISPADQAYTEITRWHPSRIVVVMSFEDQASYRLLTMLGMNAETRQIPVVLVVTSDDGEQTNTDDWAARLSHAATGVAH